MTRRINILAGITLLWGSHGWTQVASKESDASEPPTSAGFAVARVHFEQNADDGDAEVVFEAKGGAEGLAKLTVVSPDGRIVVDFTAPEASTLGMRQFRFDSPKPEDIESLKSAYPEGLYTFAGTTVAGGQLAGTAKLAHMLPPPTSFLRPPAEARDVTAKLLEISWTPVKNLAAYIIHIEQPELGINLTATLPGAAARFAVPDGFLLPGMAYELHLGTVSEDGNISFVEPRLRPLRRSNLTNQVNHNTSCLRRLSLWGFV
jgi:hypothetical protein